MKVESAPSGRSAFRLMARCFSARASAGLSSSTTKRVATFSAKVGFISSLGGEHETIRENGKWGGTESDIRSRADRELGLPGSRHGIGEAARGCGIWRTCGGARLLRRARSLLGPGVRRTAISLRLPLLRATSSLLGCTAALLALNTRPADKKFNVKTKAPRPNRGASLFPNCFLSGQPATASVSSANTAAKRLVSS